MARMVSVAGALLRANVITQEDLAEARARELKVAEKQQADRLADLARRSVLQCIPREVADEICAWQQQAGFLIPLEVLESWSLEYERRGRMALLREWAKWMSAWASAAGSES